MSSSELEQGRKIGFLNRLSYVQFVSGAPIFQVVTFVFVRCNLSSVLESVLILSNRKN